MDPTKDPCGNPLPVPPALPSPALPSLEELLAAVLPLPHLPAAELPTPCPLLLDAAEDVASG